MSRPCAAQDQTRARRPRIRSVVPTRSSFARFDRRQTVRQCISYRLLSPNRISFPESPITSIRLIYSYKLIVCPFHIPLLIPYSSCLFDFIPGSIYPCHSLINLSHQGLWHSLCSENIWMKFFRYIPICTT